MPSQRLKNSALVTLIMLYLVLTLYQLGLPGLHYDEAREAGVNAVELLQGQPVTSFRNVTVTIGGWTLPLMVQDYIGALNVYLALPFLKISGIGVPNLRCLSVLLGLLSLLTVERAVSTWFCLYAPHARTPNAGRVPVSWSGLITVALLAASPSFIFWSRQGIFVTNLTQPLTFAALWMGFRWLRTRRNLPLVFAAFLAGSALYAKLLSYWVVLPLVLVLLLFSWDQRKTLFPTVSQQSALVLLCTLAFALPLLPLLFFNLESQGTLTAIFSNAKQSYYGLNNLNFAAHVPVRWQQLIQILKGDQFWYLGGPFANPVAPYLALLGLLSGLLFNWRLTYGWLLILVGAFVLSLFTISDLFVTHYALIQPLLVALVALGLGSLIEPSARHSATSFLGRVAVPRLRFAIPSLVVALWIFFDLRATVMYHALLSRTGGFADHSDATYHLAYHLRYSGLGAPIVLDWGLDAPIRFLSQGTVRPVEIFGYSSPTAPDEGFLERLHPFIENPDNVYLLHAPHATVFFGRRELFLAAAHERKLSARLEATFSQRDGTPLVELWRLTGQGEE